MKRLPSRIIAAALTAAALLSLAACGQTEAAPEATANIEVGETVSGRKLTAGVAADNVFSLAVDFSAGLNPLKTDSSASLLACGLVYDNLFEVDAQYNLSSRVVDSYECNEAGDFWTIRIKEGIPMHDGTTLTAYDVGYSLQRAMMYSDYYASRLQCVQGVSAYSETELCISTRYANRELPYCLAIPIIKTGSILSDAPAGSGPYMFSYSGATDADLAAATSTPETEATADPEATPTPTPSPTPEPELLPDRLVAFSGYDGAATLPVDTIYLRQYTDPASMISEYESALIDLVVNDPTSIYNMGYGGMNEKRVFPTTHMHYLGFNGYSNFLCYATYRHAFNWIVDRETICSDVLDGAADPAALPINPASPLYNTDLADSLAYSPEICLQELTNAGCADLDQDGELEFALSGSKVEMDIDFIVCSDSASKVTAARQIAQNMRDIGIPVTLRELSWKDFQSTLAEPVDEDGKPTFDMYYDEVALTADWDLTRFFQAVKKNDDGDVVEVALNYGRWTVPDLVSAVQAYLAADETTVDTACLEMCQALVTSSLLIPVCFEKRTVISHLGVIRGMNPNQYSIFNGISGWTINLGQ